MKTFLEINAILIITYIVFITLPAIAMYLLVFYRRDSKKVRGQSANQQEYQFFKSLTYQTLTIENDGIKLSGRFYDNHSDKTAIMVHGFSAIPESYMAKYGKHFYDLGYNVLFIVQRAHCESQGYFSTVGIKEADDLLKWISLIEKDCNSIVIVGQSMGGFTVGYGASRMSKKVKCLIIDCGYQNVGQQLSHEAKNRRLPAKLLMPYVNFLALIISCIDLNCNLVYSLENNEIPTIFIHSRNDRVVLYQESLKNFQINKSKKLLLLTDLGDHSTAFNYLTSKQLEKMNKFIAKNK